MTPAEILVNDAVSKDVKATAASLVNDQITPWRPSVAFNEPGLHLGPSSLILALLLNE
jgi:hypothetical protein